MDQQTSRSDHAAILLSRRDALKLGGACALVAPALGQAASARQRVRSVVQINLVGGPSAQETWDPKPEAPAASRGPFRSIATRVPGLAFSEVFPRMAVNAHRFSIIRSMFHSEAPLHETGLALLQTGHFDPTGEAPAIGALAAKHLGGRDGAPPWVLLGGSIENTGVDLPKGQSAGSLGAAYEPTLLGDRSTSTSLASFVDHCRDAAAWVERGTRVVTINMGQTVFNQPSWDVHAWGGRLPTTFDDYKRLLAPTFDRGFVALLDELDRRGLKGETLVVASGEFGRSPTLNERGGRDHWPGCWSALVAGGAAPAGTIIGRSDQSGGEPIDDPIPAAALARMMADALGLPLEPSSDVERPASQRVFT